MTLRIILVIKCFPFSKEDMRLACTNLLHHPKLLAIRTISVHFNSVSKILPFIQQRMEVISGIRFAYRQSALTIFQITSCQLLLKKACCISQSVRYLVQELKGYQWGCNFLSSSRYVQVFLVVSPPGRFLEPRSMVSSSRRSLSFTIIAQSSV